MPLSCISPMPSHAAEWRIVLQTSKNRGWRNTQATAPSNLNAFVMAHWAKVWTELKTAFLHISVTEAVLENTKGFREAPRSPTTTGSGSAPWQISAGCLQARQTPSHLYGEDKDLKSFRVGWAVSNRSLERDSTWSWRSSTFLVCDEKNWPQKVLSVLRNIFSPL